MEDLRIHSAEVDEESLSVSEGRKVRTRAVDWTSGRFGMCVLTFQPIGSEADA